MNAERNRETLQRKTDQDKMAEGAPPFLMGRKLYLRPLLASDLTERYLSWLNDAEVTRYVEAGSFPVTKGDLEEYCQNMKHSRTNLVFAIVDRKKGVHIGNIKLGGINWIHRFGDLGILIGDKKYWSKGYGEEACRLLLEYAFGRLNLNKIILGSYATHIAALKTYSKVGFKIEGRMKKMLNNDGKYVDKLLMGVLQSQYNRTREAARGGTS